MTGPAEEPTRRAATDASAPQDAEQPLLRVAGLRVAFDGDDGTTVAVDGVSFEVGAGRALGVVGESGCGKSVTSLAILRLLPEPPARVLSGEIFLGDRDLLRLSEKEMRAVRGREVAMIFQDPSSALNPVLRVGAQIAEGLRTQLGLSRSAARARAIELLRKVGIPAPEERVDSFPHELSGGMKQRVMIAMALACGPKVLVADEPTTALDVTIQAQILELLARLRAEEGLSVVLITHDLGVVAGFVDDVVVMYAGTVVERAPVAAIFAEPMHPYTQGLLRSVPGFGANAAQDRLPTIRGVVPSLRALARGCRFRDRCDRAVDRCAEGEPPLVTIGPRRAVACFVAAAGMDATAGMDQSAAVGARVGRADAVDSEASP